MSRFHHYDPEQMYLLPPSVAEVLSEEHLCFHGIGWWKRWM